MALGFASFNKFKLKINFLEQFSYLVRFVEMKIQYTEEPIFNIFSSFKTENKILKSLLSNYTSNLKNNNISTNKFLDCKVITNKIETLNDDEIDIINNFMENLGNSDLISQVKLCRVVENSLQEKTKLAFIEKINKSRLYFLLHLAVGLVFIIIFL